MSILFYTRRRYLVISSNQDLDAVFDTRTITELIFYVVQIRNIKQWNHDSQFNAKNNEKDIQININSVEFG